MADLIINGGNKLSGSVVPSGNKNSTLPIIAATMLTKEEVVLRNFPDLVDVNLLIETMKELGSKIDWDKKNKVVKIKNDEISLDQFDGKFPANMRGTILLIAPLVYRLKKLNWSTKIGGCTLGIREIDPHLEVLKALGLGVKFENGNIEIDGTDGFKNGNLWLDYMSVTTTEAFAMAASIATGKSVLTNAASEPHVQELCKVLNLMGANVEGIGTSSLSVEGVDTLKGFEYKIESDYHEVTTFLALGAMTGGRIEVKNVLPDNYSLIIKTFKKLGVDVKFENGLAIVEENQKLVIEEPFTKNMLPKIEAAPWPYVSTDLLPLFMALSTKSKGEIMFWNKVFEGANLWIPELIKFGVKAILCDPHRVIIWGGRKLVPAEVEGPDIIRATVALFMIAQSIKGESRVNNADTIKRAHPEFVERLVELGADVKWED
ncbi:MAG: UDP-N-acetylglucosamine 1-carboxyvinyltransferase [bacterium]